MWAASGWVALAAAMVAGCGRYGYDPVTADGDGGSDGAIGPDAALGMFGAALPFEELNGSSDDDDPSLTGDLLEIYFKSTRGPGNDPDIWRASRAESSDTWGPAEQVDELSTNSADDTPEVSLDGLTIHFASDRSGGAGGTDIWRATRASRGDPWSGITRVAELSTAASEYAAVTDALGLNLVLNRDAGANLGLLAASRASIAEAWNEPVLQDELESAGYEADAVLDGSGRVIYFTSDRAGGAGARDLYTAVRATPSQPFSAPVAVTELNTAFDDEDPWVSPDLRTLVFVRNESGSKAIFISTR